jgi:hypothetical protein
VAATVDERDLRRGCHCRVEESPRVKRLAARVVSSSRDQQPPHPTPCPRRPQPAPRPVGPSQPTAATAATVRCAGDVVAHEILPAGTANLAPINLTVPAKQEADVPSSFEVVS